MGRDVGLRIFLAAIISALGATGTFLWSKANRIVDTAGGPAPVARIAASTNEVQRRPAERYIWLDVLKNQELYPGEAIRTSSRSEAQIEFQGQTSKDKTLVHLDPDSVIEIEYDENGLNLDFLQGNLFIETLGNGSPITLQSGEEKIKLLQPEVSISKPSQEAPLDIQVFRGHVKVVQPSKQSAVQVPKIKLLEPRPNQPVYLLPDAGELVKFKWQPLDPSYQVVIESGTERSQLKPVDGVQSVSGVKGEITLPMDLGKNYFRLLAVSERGDLPKLTSTVSWVEVRAKNPPLPLMPAMNTALSVKEGELAKKVTFRWSNPGQLKKIVLEVARSPDLKKDSVIYRNESGDVLTHDLDLNSAPGPVYWRVSGQMPNSNQVVSSRVHTFLLQSGEVGPLLAPRLRAPVDNAAVSYAVMSGDGISLEWEPVPNAVQYEVSLKENFEQVPEGEGPRVYQSQTRASRMNIRNLKPMAYEWSVVAVDANGRRSESSDPGQFVVEGVPILAWTDRIGSEQVASDGVALVRMAWEEGPPQAVKWRVRVLGEREPASSQSWLVASRPEYLAQLRDTGVYRVEAEALNAQGVVIAHTEPRSLKVTLPALLPAPSVTDIVGSVIQAKSDGTAEISWSAVPSAKEYVLDIRNADGSTLQSVTSVTTQASLSDLKTGEYKVTLKTIDQNGRAGSPSPEYTLSVPEYSGIAAPKLKSVNVK